MPRQLDRRVLTQIVLFSVGEVTARNHGWSARADPCRCFARLAYGQYQSSTAGLFANAMHS